MTSTVWRSMRSCSRGTTPESGRRNCGGSVPTLRERDLGRIGYARRSSCSGAGRAAQARRDSGSVSDRRASAHDHDGAQRAHGKSAGARGDAGARRASRFIRPTAAATSRITGPGQIVGYPIVDLREWKRDVVAYVRAIEQVIIDALADFGLAGGPRSGDDGRVGGRRARSPPSACTSAAGSRRTGSR